MSHRLEVHSWEKHAAEGHVAPLWARVFRRRVSAVSAESAGWRSASAADRPCRPPALLRGLRQLVGDHLEEIVGNRQRSPCRRIDQPQRRPRARRAVLLDTELLVDSPFRTGILEVG